MPTHVSWSRSVLLLLAVCSLCFTLAGCGTPAVVKDTATDHVRQDTVLNRATQADEHNGIVAKTQTIMHSRGCGSVLPFARGTSMNETLVSSGLRRMYRLHIPGGYSNTTADPLILNFHGHGSSGPGQEKLTAMSQLADTENFIVAYPQGTVGADHRTGWNTGPWNYPHVDDVRFASDLMTRLETQLCIDPQRIYAVGFSNGGGMTNELACTMANRIAAVAIVSGAVHPLSNGCHPARPMPILDFHGTHDAVVPYTGNKLNDEEPPIPQWLDSWVARDKCINIPVITYPQRGIMHEQWDSCQDNTHVIHYRLSGGIHTWPLPGNGLSIDGHSIDATTLLWQFLRGYSL